MARPALKLLQGDRQDRESKNAVLACNDFLRLGPGRTLVYLAQQYRQTSQNLTNKPPTKSLATLRDWHLKFNWPARAEAYDTILEAEKNEAEQRRRQEIMNSGFALTYERVAALNQVANFLLDQIAEEVVVTPPAQEFADWQPLAGVSAPTAQNEAPTKTRPNVWLKDVKQIGRGDDAERVDIVRFNSALFEQFRGLLDDLAKETGGRVTKTENKTALEGEVELRHSVDPERYSRALTTLADALGASVSPTSVGGQSAVDTTE